MRKRTSRGFTLIELMMVVAIVGILAALGGAAILTVVRASRVAQTAKGIAAMLSAARLRALTTSCAHFVQINGAGYAGGGTSGSKGSLALVSKGNCASSNYFFEADGGVADDRIVDTSRLASEGLLGGVIVTSPMVTGADNDIELASVCVGYSGVGFGAVLPGARGLAADDDGDGTFAAALGPADGGVYGAELFTVKDSSSLPGAPQPAKVVVPTQGIPVIQ